MTYIVQRQESFYVVAYEGIDPITGPERRRWHPIGYDRDEAEHVAARLDRERGVPPASTTGQLTVGEFLTNSWIPHKRRQVRATTAYRYAWFVERSINHALGHIPLRRLRADHLDTLYDGPRAPEAVPATGSHPRRSLKFTQSSEPPSATLSNAISSTAT